MPADATEITVAANGSIYVADITGSVGFTYPTTLWGTLSTLSPLWKDVGYATEDGVTFRAAPSVENINVWQKATPARRIVTAREVQVSTNLVQWNKDTLPVVFGGGSVYVAGTVGGGTTWRYDPPADTEALRDLAVIVDWQDGSRKYRAVLMKSNVTEAIETNLTRGGPAVLPVTFDGVAPDTEVRAAFFLSDDAGAFA